MCIRDSMASESIAHLAFGLMAIDSEPIRARGIIVNYHFHAARRSRRVAFQSLRLFLPEDNQIIASVWLLFTADKNWWLYRRPLTCFIYMYALKSEWALGKPDLKRKKTIGNLLEALAVKPVCQSLIVELQWLLLENPPRGTQIFWLRLKK